MGLIFSLGLLPDSMNPFAGAAKQLKDSSSSSCSSSSSILLCMCCIVVVLPLVMQNKGMRSRVIKHIKKIGGSDFDTSSYDFSSSEF